MSSFDDPNVLNFPGRQNEPNRIGANAPSQNADVLAELKSALADTEHSPSAATPSKASRSDSQTIIGAGNMQAGRDLHVHEDRQAPQLAEYILCPACGSQIPPLADICWHCNNNVARHFAILHARRVRSRATVAALVCFSVFGIALGALEFDLVPQTWRTGTGIVAGVSALFAMMIARDIS